MTNLDILVPFGLPPSELASDLVRSVNTPALATLLARAKQEANEDIDPFSRALAHELWLAQKFGLGSQNHVSGPPIATTMMRSLGHAPASGTWFVLQPAHLHVARDHLVLTDPWRLPITEQESRALFATVLPLFEESGKTLIYADSHLWFMRSDEWTELHTSTPDAASGHNIDIWMPRGAGERDWRKLLNEVQMAWHSDPINQAREMHGLKPVNSLWLWGGAAAAIAPGGTPYQHVFNLSGWIQTLAESASVRQAEAGVEGVLNSPGTQGLLYLDALIDPALAGDWGSWINHLQDLENTWFSPLLENLKNGKVQEVRFILTHGSRLIERTAGKFSIKKFWIKPSLDVLYR